MNILTKIKNYSNNIFILPRTGISSLTSDETSSHISHISAVAHDSTGVELSSTVTHGSFVIAESASIFGMVTLEEVDTEESELTLLVEESVPEVAVE